MAQFEKVDCKYGAPMGRPEQHGDGSYSGKARCFRVRLDNGGYDQGWAYWGHPADLWCAQNANFRLFTRAPSRAAAKAAFNARFPARSHTIKWTN